MTPRKGRARNRRVDIVIQNNYMAARRKAKRRCEDGAQPAQLPDK